MKLVTSVSWRKLRGWFYTPEPIADFVLKWVLSGNDGQDILEPSCWDGIFLKQAWSKKYSYKSITAIELDPEEAKKAKDLGTPKTKVINSDFHEFCNSTEQKFDAIVWNPPYIRYQYFDRDQQEQAEKIFNRVGIKYSKLMNAWTSFVAGSCLLLKNQWRMGFVLPAEFLQVSYAKPLRNFLGHFFHKINIVSFKKLVFPDIQQEVILLLCEKSDADKHLIEHIEIENAESLKDIDIDLLKSPKKEIDFKENKWTFYFLDQDEINFIEKIKSNHLFKKIKDFARVEVGITTWANDFFTVSEKVVSQYDLKDYAKRLVWRSSQLPSLVFDGNDWENNNNADTKSHILVFPSKEVLRNNKKALEYLESGEASNVHKWYKCGIRTEWQIIPSIKTSNALFTRRNNVYPKLIENSANAYTTDTTHRVYVDEGVNLKSFTASYYNSLSFAFAEISWRSHWWWVLELMPNEVEEIVLPYNIENEKLLGDLDEMIRSKTPIEEVLDYADKFILKDGYGLTDQEIKIARNIWKKLSRRRMGRKNA